MSVLGNQIFAVIYVEGKQVQPVPHGILEAPRFGMLIVSARSTN